MHKCLETQGKFGEENNPKMQIINCTKTFLGLVRSRSHSKTSIFPVPFRIPGHFGDGVGFVEGDTGLVQVRDDHFCPGGHNSGKTQPPGAPLISNSILFSLCHNCSNKQLKVANACLVTFD